MMLKLPTAFSVLILGEVEIRRGDGKESDGARPRHTTTTSTTVHEATAAQTTAKMG